MNEKENLPVTSGNDMLTSIKDKKNLALSLYFDNDLFTRCRTIANIMANAEGITPKHLIGKPETCYAVVTRSILWNLDPLSVANSTYEVKGRFGYEGKLCRAILEKSGHFEDRLKYEKIGDWSSVQDKFKIINNGKGDYAAPIYTKEDEEGLGVKITYKLRDKEESTFTFYLKQAFPRNSTLWATDPWTQLCYLGTRRFASLEVPDVFLGIPFDKENINDTDLRDVTPKASPVKPENRKKADDINQIIKDQETKKSSSKVSKSKKKDQAELEIKADDEKQKDDGESVEVVEEKGAAEKRADDIINLMQVTEDAEALTKIFNDNFSHLNVMPEALYEKVLEAFHSKQEQLNNTE